MSAIFVDSHFFLAILNTADALHAHAEHVSRQHNRPRVTTTWVLAEVADGLARTQFRPQVVELVHYLRSNPRVQIIPATQELFDRGMELYAERPDKEWSLTDCISFLVMRDAGLDEALTGDHHFEQAGFRILM